MKHVIKVGTDVASLCFFDPAALPADVDERLKKHYDKVGRALDAEGRMGWIDYDSDGSYVMHFYVNEPVPENIARHARNPRSCERLLVPSGTMIACGAEYLCSDPWRGTRGAGGLAKYPHMGASFQLPAGDYASIVWDVEWPEEAEEEAIAAKLDPSTARLRTTLNTAMGYLLMAVLGLGLTLAVTTCRRLEKTGDLAAWQVWGWPVLAVMIAGAFYAGRRLSRLQSAIAPATDELPSFVVHLRRHPAA